ncbi:MAG: helix-turn-helix transcriptional regulator [bacterium]|nr:helix-turn-helix transcriptional regulator [bacterium]
MKNYDSQKIDQFINALQLSINSSINSITDNDADNHYSINITKQKNDTQLQYFTKIIKGHWTNQSTYLIQDTDTAFSQDFINFLLVTRLNKDNMIKIADIDSIYTLFVDKLGFFQINENNIIISNSEQLRNIIFETIKKNNFTLREISEKIGITQTALSNYKAGSDIRISSLLKILKVLDLKMILD